jgi:hypothetical protein
MTFQVVANRILLWLKDGRKRRHGEAGHVGQTGRRMGVDVTDAEAEAEVLQSDRKIAGGQRTLAEVASMQELGGGVPACGEFAVASLYHIGDSLWLVNPHPRGQLS